MNNMKNFVKILREIAVFMGVMLGVSFGNVVINGNYNWTPVLAITGMYSIWYVYDLIKNRKYY